MRVKSKRKSCLERVVVLIFHFGMKGRTEPSHLMASVCNDDGPVCVIFCISPTTICSNKPVNSACAKRLKMASVVKICGSIVLYPWFSYQADLLHCLLLHRYYSKLDPK